MGPLSSVSRRELMRFCRSVARGSITNEEILRMRQVRLTWLFRREELG